MGWVGAWLNKGAWPVQLGLTNEWDEAEWSGRDFVRGMGGKGRVLPQPRLVSGRDEGG